MDRDLELAKRLAEAVDRAGGRVYFVGGLVRDRLLGRENKDIDVEVHGVTPEALTQILETLGEPVAKGASFGVMGLRHSELDIAMPRRERATGRGHKDFAVFVDPFLGEEKAAMRRDFTINAMMENVLTGEVLDFFGGRRDLSAGILRHVSDESYAEDPLRVFRAAQFAARFDFAVAEETRAISSRMAVDALAGERVMGELEKALLKAERPSIFFEELRAMDQLGCWFPEIAALIGVPQPPRHHPEGDVWRHTMQVLDEAARLRAGAEQPLWFMLAALCHDLGKPVTTAETDGRLHAYGHETAGLPIAQAFLARLTSETKLRQYVLNLTQLHMQPNMMAAQHAREKGFMKLFDRAVSPADLLLLARADFLGRQVVPADREALAAEYAPTEQVLREMLALFDARMARPFLQGRDLIAAGVEPGPRFHEALAYAHKLRLAGLDREEQLRQALGYIRKK